MWQLLATITFPSIDPVALRLGALEVRWYGLAYVLAFILGYAGLQRMSRRGITRIPSDLVSDLVAWLAGGVVLGGRLGWWLIYDRPTAQEPWYEPFALWHGGMSFHGGIVGVCVALLLWTRRRSIPFWDAADALAVVTPIGLFLGRIANFINAELVGRVTNVPWGVVFPGEMVARHPSQLYEAVLEGPIVLITLLLIRRHFRHRHEGQLAAMFLICYGVLRFLVEFTRQPDQQVGFVAFSWLTMGQLLSVIIVLVGVGIWIFRSRSSREPPGRFIHQAATSGLQA